MLVRVVSPEEVTRPRAAVERREVVKRVVRKCIFVREWSIVVVLT